MRIIEIELGIIALSIVGLTAVLVPVLLRLKRLSKESEHLLRHFNAELPRLFQQVGQVIRRMDEVAATVKQVAARVESFSDAIAGIGKTITDVHTSLRRNAEALLLGLNKYAYGWIAGARAAFRVIKRGTTSSRYRRRFEDQHSDRLWTAAVVTKGTGPVMRGMNRP